jgi:plasmid stability protein
MPDMLIRNIRPETMAFLRLRAAARGHSVQAEVRELLDRLASDRSAALETARRVTAGWRTDLAKPADGFGDAARDIRDDRDTDHGRA